MKRGRFSEYQIISIFKEADAGVVFLACLSPDIVAINILNQAGNPLIALSDFRCTSINLHSRVLLLS